MRDLHRARRRMSRIALLGSTLALGGFHCSGLDLVGYLDLHVQGVDRYLHAFEPDTSTPMGEWTRHSFDPDGGAGPLCIDGSPFTVFTKRAHPLKLLIFLEGGGACWQDFYFCTARADREPPAPTGILADSFDAGDEVIENPFADWSVLYVSYCDGSVFSGDNALEDPSFPGGPIRHHRGLRNLSAAMDVAREEFPYALNVLLAGSSAGGVGAAGFAPFLFRFTYGNLPRLHVVNDAGPVAVNLEDTEAIRARARDWRFGRFFPVTCQECDAEGQVAEIIEWRLKHDRGVRESLYSTDGDVIDRFFLDVPTQEAYRELLLSVHGPIHRAFPRRYKRFIRSGSTVHTALGDDLFYTAEANGVPLYRWVRDLVYGRSGWRDLVEDFVPAN